MVISPTLTNGRRARRRADTEDRILRAALDLFSRRGFAAVAVEEITEAADIAKGTFFNYFPSKDAVLIRLFGQFSDELQLASDVSVLSADLASTFRAMLHRLYCRPQLTPILFRSLIGATMTNHRVAEEFRTFMLRNRGIVTRLMEHAQRTGAVRRDIPAAVLARNLQQMMVGTQVIWSLSEPTEKSGTSHNGLALWADVAFDIFWRGIESQPAPLPQTRARARKDRKA